MSGIEKITERILADAREQAEANRAEAAGKAKEILAAGDALAEKKRQAILDQAKAEEIELHKRRRRSAIWRCARIRSRQSAR